MNKLIPAAALLVLMGTGGCASAPRCKPLHPYKIGGMTIYPVVCPASAMNKVCDGDDSDPDTHINACAWRKKGSQSKKCWIMASDDIGGAEAVFHEHAHCAGASENTARCDDWPGGEDEAPPGQFCDKPWPRGLGREE